MMYSNVDCLTKGKQLELNAMVQQHKCDVIAITEVFPKQALYDNNQEETYKIENYDIFLSELKGRGVAIYVKKRTNSQPNRKYTRKF